MNFSITGINSDVTVPGFHALLAGEPDILFIVKCASSLLPRSKTVFRTLGSGGLIKFQPAGPVKK
jgi:hypothetical protein